MMFHSVALWVFVSIWRSFICKRKFICWFDSWSDGWIVYGVRQSLIQQTSLAILPMPTSVAEMRFTPAFVCLSVCLSFYQHHISKTTAARISTLDVEMLHHEFWKSIYFGVEKVKCQGHEAQRCTDMRFCTLVSADFFVRLIFNLWLWPLNLTLN